MAIASVNPATGQEVARFDEHTPDEVSALLDRAVAGYAKWRAVGFAERGAVLKAAADLAIERRDELAGLTTLEMGKLIGEARVEVDMSADVMRYFAEHAEGMVTTEPFQSSLGKAVVRHLPIGVLLGIQPWNFPMFQVVRFTVPNLMLGNAVACKHSSNMPQFAIAMEKLFRDAGAPDGVYVNLLISGERASALLDDPRIAGASLTGSERAGASLATAAGRNLKKCVLELGGSDPMVVLADADFDHAVSSAIAARILNAGQECISPKRIIVERPIYDRFVAAFVDGVTALRIGDPTDPDSQMGPVVSEKAAEQLKDQIDRAVSGGARILAGGNRIDRPGAWLEPTVLVDVGPDNPVYREEIFGPVAVLAVAEDADDAIRLANDTPFGLGASVYSSNLEHAGEVAGRIDAGMVFVNQPTNAAPDLPFGGVKRSGFGRELARFGMDEFCNRKLVVVGEGKA